MPPLFMKGCARIYSKVGLAAGSYYKMSWISAFAEGGIGVWSGNEYWFALILL